MRFTIFDARDQDARVAGNEPARLDQDAQAERLEQRHQAVGVFLRRQNVFRLRGGFPPLRRTAGQRRVVNNAQAAADAEKFQTVFVFQALHQRQHFAHGLLERIDVRDLRADVHLQSAQAQVFQFAGARVDAFDFLERDAEFIFVSAGGDFGVRVRLDVRVHAHGDGRDFFQARGDAVDALQFRLALGVEGINALLERELDFLLGFAHARENAFARDRRPPQ